jgi:hypothetical protein
MSTPSYFREIQIEIEGNLFFFYGDRDPSAFFSSPDAPDYVAALSEAEKSPLNVGAVKGIVVVFTPRQWSLAPMRIEVWTAEPPGDNPDWDHVVDIDIDISTGNLYFEAPDMGGDPVRCEVPAANYRARIAGRGYDTPPGEGQDSYRIQLWSRKDRSTPIARKIWQGGTPGSGW